LPSCAPPADATKTSSDVDGTVSYFAPDLATCTDATLGWDFGSTKVTSVYDSRQLSPARRAALVLGPHGRVAG